MRTLRLDTLGRELVELVDEIAPPLIYLEQIDMEHLERLVTEDDLLSFGGECFEHDGCRPV